MSTCPLCHMELDRDMRPKDDSVDVMCQNCGYFYISNPLLSKLQKNEYSRWERARLSYALRRLGATKLLTTEYAESLLQSTQLPDAMALQDNLLLHIANEMMAPGEAIEIRAPAIRASIGAQSSEGAQWVVEEALSANLIKGLVSRTILGSGDYRVGNVNLTLAGWTRVNELMRTAKDSRKAFMAMKFGTPQLDMIFRDYFKPAVRQTGFDLMRLDEEPRAGLIDDRLRLEIRTSRFMIADLTHQNNGAYWEAGFAEGLGRPVIYTCRKDVFEDPKTRPHFDTNHYLTVVWDLENPAAAAEQLKTVIRVTMPTEATLNDN
jgi:hypothetical protein